MISKPPIDVASALCNLSERGFERIYLCHVRRTGGTSLNESFFSLFSRAPQLLMATMRRSTSKVVCIAGTRIVGANRPELEGGRYFYGYSHVPQDELALPSGTCRIALFRDPLERVISHYRMLRGMEELGVQRRWLPLERTWLGNSIMDFAALLPKERLLAQLYMFSKQYSITGAAESARSCNFILRQSNYADDVRRLGLSLGLPLVARHANGARYQGEFDEQQLNDVRAQLAPEYEFLKKVAEDK